jgi:hypothetical protein
MEAFGLPLLSAFDEHGHGKVNKKKRRETMC